MNIEQWNNKCSNSTTFTMTSPPNNIAQAIWTGKAIIGTDGSVLNNNATYGVSILIQQEDEEQPKIAFSVGSSSPILRNSLTWTPTDQKQQPSLQR
jgi:hypothetical protein